MTKVKWLIHKVLHKFQYYIINWDKAKIVLTILIVTYD